MGLFDKLRKQKESVKENEQTENTPYGIQYHTTKDGKLQVDFYDKQADFKQFYDTTTLIVNASPKIISNSMVYEALVSYYHQDDAIMFDQNNNIVGSRTDYKNILLGLDLNLLQKDANYCSSLMKTLLNRKRVEQYLQEGLKENPSILCGNYVGEIQKVEGKYKKVFRTDVGNAVHNSSKMVERRAEHRRNKEEQKQREMASKQQEIKRLQQEIEDLSK